MVMGGCTGFGELPVGDEPSRYSSRGVLSDPANTGLLLLDFDVTRQKMLLGAQPAVVSGAYIADIELPDRIYATSTGDIGVLFHGLPPGRYQVTELIAEYMDPKNSETLRLDVSGAHGFVDVPDGLVVDVPAGAAVYVGKLTAHVSRTHSGGIDPRDISYAWQKDPQRELKLWQAIHKKYAPSKWDAMIESRIAVLSGGTPKPAVASPSSSTAEELSALVVDDVSLGPIAPQTESFQVSPDARHVAFVNQAGDSKRFVVTDKGEGAEYDRIDWPFFNADGSRLAYQAHRGRQAFLVLDGKEGPAYDDIRIARFSADGMHVGYVAVRDGKEFIVVDGQEGKPFDEIEKLTLSADGQHTSFFAKSRPAGTVEPSSAPPGQRRRQARDSL
jgi:hypothetical protein